MLRTRSGKKCQLEESPPKERGDWENHHHPDSPGESFQKAKLGKKEKKPKQHPNKEVLQHAPAGWTAPKQE